MADIGTVKRRGKTKDAEIESKDQRWHVRNRLTLVFGSNDIEDLETYTYTDKGVEFKTVPFHQAKSKAIEELLDNCIDEYYRGHVTEIHTVLASDGKTVTVRDNGIGFPLNKVEQVYTEFRTGSKFKDEETDEKGFLHRTLGQNGLGAAATCLTSDLFKVTVKHYNSGKEQTYTFTDGALKTAKTKPKAFKGASGVEVEIQLSKQVYKDNTVNSELLRKRIIDLAYNNPGLTFTFNKEKFLFKKGVLELCERVDPNNAQLLGEESYVYETTNVKGKKVKGKIDLTIAVAVDPDSDERERFISFVNSTPTYDGGFHHDKAKRLFINAIKEKLERQAKKEKISFVDNDILAGATFVIGLTMPNPRFESQTKRKLVRDLNLEKCIDGFMAKAMDKFIRKNKDMMEAFVERAKSRTKYQVLKEASKKGKKLKKQKVEKLLDANERKDRSKCTLFICEGDSAIGGLRSARNKLYQGGIALRGKPMNVSQSTISDILENQEFMDITASVGLTIGQPAEPKDLRYSKIVFLADSDVDGGHINTLLTNFFYHFWPELFDQGAIQLAKAPLFEVVTDKTVEYAETPDELESMKKKGVKIKEIHRNKGLGEMSPEAWKHLLQRENFTRIDVVDKKNARQMLHVCFGKDANLRKDLLMDSSSSRSSEQISVSSTSGGQRKAKALTTKAAPAKKAAAKKAPVKKASAAKKVTKKKTVKKAK
ncbi:MAG: hypothetical protein COW01_00600 [Bdellovibrionales bacterium CG12_big_fil_rev_8_21_14_0_65_38_15]|nr:MAG: hypothetical protein COW79_10135 [Bdellovibrionales bacterium CG22_combo_CG10-13_8_21_14_all_38_13]PIQ57466.1 MAG: hypothetical protein COW01_00600 [Bdellovibrionales bacterium CG12_big_fil_rev_8_21_14_0_65_38_15]PIR31187.1 MAG: hypothetical protein COV38_02080 [Bdellovibrionales bacterium CG11_big_fil_rev_8_21_14_0_20_38_13]